ncbi:MAG: acetoacetate decarboxylase family protein [Actinomycetota bacterium]
MPVRTYQIQGRTVTLPVEIRKATMWAAIYLVDPRAARAMVPRELKLMRPRTALTIAFVRYEDGDLDAYNELAVSFSVLPFGVYIRHLPVNQTFTLEAGRTIWGYPKFLADIDIDEGESHTVCTLTIDCVEALQLRVKNDGAFPNPQLPIPTYSDADGTLHRTRWHMRGKARARLGGATIRLGEGTIADELRSLGLPKRAFITSTVRNVRATFGPSTIV